jgi:hypothetical protein
MQPRVLLKRNAYCIILILLTSIYISYVHVRKSVKKTELTAGGIRCAGHATPSVRKSWHYVDRRRSLGRYSLLAD